MTVYVLPPHIASQAAGVPVFDVTTHGEQFRPMSPMLLGPIPLYGDMWSQNMENAWQYAKLYAQHEHGPDAYWQWAFQGWASARANRHPMGKDARPVCSLWAGDRLDYITARQRIYIPLYAQAVRMYALQLYAELHAAAKNGDIIITDFDAYDRHSLSYSLDAVIADPTRKMGHGFVLAMMLEGLILESVMSGHTTVSSPGSYMRILPRSMRSGCPSHATRDTSRCPAPAAAASALSPRGSCCPPMTPSPSTARTWHRKKTVLNSQLTQIELRAIGKALTASLASGNDRDGIGIRDYQSAQQKIQWRINGGRDRIRKRKRS